MEIAVCGRRLRPVARAPSKVRGRSASLALPCGCLSVNRRFIISGFVTFMALERRTRLLDFLVSRYPRLFPAYWVALALTLAVAAVAGLPGKAGAPLRAQTNYPALVDGWRIGLLSMVFSSLVRAAASGRAAVERPAMRATRCGHAKRTALWPA